MPDDDTADDTIDVEGYYQCVDCHRWVVQGMEVTSARLCSDCARRRGTDAATARLNYEVEGRRFTIEPGKLPKKDKRERTRSLTRRLQTDAWSAAIGRLIIIHRPLFDILYAEEKARRGLDPKVRPRTLPARQIAREVLAIDQEEMSEAVERVRDIQEQKTT